MKRIVLVRHATAVETGPGGSDFHRRLKKRGRREAAVMADRVTARVGRPDLVVSSPADRAVETARAFTARSGYDMEKIVLQEELYGGLLPEEFLRIVNGIDDAVGLVMLFGHDPSFSEFAALLVPEFKEVVPKGGAVVIDVDRKSWRRIRRGDGRLVAFERPPALEEQKRIEEDLLDSLARRVRTVLLAVVREMDIAENREVVREVARASTRLARVLRPFATAVPKVSPRNPASTVAPRPVRRATTRSAGERRRRKAKRS